MNKTIVISGANRGIGLSFVDYYLQNNDYVYAVCRQSSELLKKKLSSTAKLKIIEGVDLLVSESLAFLVSALDGVEIDLLINNAGILNDESLGMLDFKSITQQFEVNTLGALRVTECLLAQLKNTAKVALITSRMGSIADNSSGGRYGYRMSKSALNAAGKSLAIDLLPRGRIRHPERGIFHPLWRGGYRCCH